MATTTPADVFPGATLRQLVEWGYPQGALRAAPPPDLGFGVVHITGNHRLPGAEGEINWRLNDPANQNSATFFVNRDGSVWQALGDPLHMAPWSNGDVRSPDLSNRRIAACVSAGVNPNIRTVVSIENVGYEPGSSITPEQERANAAILRYYLGKARIPISRETIVGHYQINGTNRPNCPGVDKSVLDRIVTLAVGQPEEPEVDFSTIRHQVVKIVRIREGATLYRQPVGDDVHWVVPQGQAFDADLLLAAGDRFLCRRVAKDGGFWITTDAIERRVDYYVPQSTAAVQATAELNARLDNWVKQRPR